MAFSSDGASTIASSQGDVVVQIRNQVNMFLLNCHCVAHLTNFATLDDAKAPACKVLSSKREPLLNLISSFFNKSNKHRHAFTALQE